MDIGLVFISSYSSYSWHSSFLPKGFGMTLSCRRLAANLPASVPLLSSSWHRGPSLGRRHFDTPPPDSWTAGLQGESIAKASNQSKHVQTHPDYRFISRSLVFCSNSVDVLHYLAVGTANMLDGFARLKHWAEDPILDPVWEFSRCIWRTSLFALYFGNHQSIASVQTDSEPLHEQCINLHIWVWLKMQYIPKWQFSIILIWIMMINQWTWESQVFRQTHVCMLYHVIYQNARYMPLAPVAMGAPSQWLKWWFPDNLHSPVPAAACSRQKARSGVWLW
jgi:hypothetical protein